MANPSTAYCTGAAVALPDRTTDTRRVITTFIFAPRRPDYCEVAVKKSNNQRRHWGARGNLGTCAINCSRTRVREKEYLRKDASRVPVLVARALFEWKPEEGVSFVIDMTDRKRAKERLRASEQRFLDAQMELAHVTRITTLGELAGSIAHEVNQPLAAVVTNAEA